MVKLTQELESLARIRKTTLFALVGLTSLLLSFTLTALDNVIGGVVDGLNGTHQYDPRTRHEPTK